MLVSFNVGSISATPVLSLIHGPTLTNMSNTYPRTGSTDAAYSKANRTHPCAYVSMRAPTFWHFSLLPLLPMGPWIHYGVAASATHLLITVVGTCNCRPSDRHRHHHRHRRHPNPDHYQLSPAMGDRTKRTDGHIVYAYSADNAWRNSNHNPNHTDAA